MIVNMFNSFQMESSEYTQQIVWMWCIRCWIGCKWIGWKSKYFKMKGKKEIANEKSKNNIGIIFLNQASLLVYWALEYTSQRNRHIVGYDLAYNDMAIAWHECVLDSLISSFVRDYVIV